MSGLFKGISLHPKELLGESTSHFLILSLSMAVPPDHIAEFLLFLSDAPLFWFTVNTSTIMFSISPDSLACLLAIMSAFLLPRAIRENSFKGGLRQLVIVILKDGLEKI
jgi:hypothetical protein